VTTDRADRVAERWASATCDALLVTDLINVRWLTGFTGSSGAAVVGVDGTRRFVTDFRYLTQSAEQLDESWSREISSDLLQGVASSCPAEASCGLGFDDAKLSVPRPPPSSAARREGCVSSSPPAARSRRCARSRTRAKLDKIRARPGLATRAGRGADPRPLGRTERDVALDIEFTMRRMGAEAVSFPRSSPRPARRAAARGPARRRDPAGTLCVIDWGAQLDGYASTARARTPPARSTRATRGLRARRQRPGGRARRGAPGPTGREVDAVARAIIDAAGHAEHFGHGLGHGVGLEVHEGPRLSKQGETRLGRAWS
jgi:Xaa-Pro aminopeptidase